MRIRKTFCLVVLQVAVVLCLTGCGKDFDVSVCEDAMKDFIEVTAKFNMPESPEDMKDKYPRITTTEGGRSIFKGYENLSEEKLKQEYYDIIARSYSNSESGYFKFNDEQLKRIADARLNLLKNLDYSVESEEFDKAGCVIVSVKALDSIAMERSLEKNVVEEITKKYPNLHGNVVISDISALNEKMRDDITECVCTAMIKVCKNPIFLDNKEKAYTLFSGKKTIRSNKSLPDVRTIFWSGTPLHVFGGPKDAIYLQQDREDLFFESKLFYAWCKNGANLAYSKGAFVNGQHLSNVSYFYMTNVEFAASVIFEGFARIWENAAVGGDTRIKPSEVNKILTENEKALNVLKNEYDKFDNEKNSGTTQKKRIKDKFSAVISELAKLNSFYKNQFLDNKNLTQSEKENLARATSEAYIHYRNFGSWVDCEL